MRVTAIISAIVLGSCATTELAPERGARETAVAHALSRFVDRLRADPNAPPGFVVVATTSEGFVFERAYGVRDLTTGAPMTLDTPIYNASVTKAYTGLLAAVLDEEGVLPLESSLRDVWSDLHLPPPLDAERITATQLLSHTSGMSAGGLGFRSTWTGEVAASDVPDHLARHAVSNGEAFQYSNGGPFVYSAMAETRTGEAWSTALEQRVLRPLRLARTVARLEALPVDEIAHCHGRSGGAWRTLPHKQTALMNAAGGMYASGRDSARFLQAFLSDGASAQGRISAAVLRRTWQRASAQDRVLWGMHRDGYGLGWDLGTIDGRRFVSRSGGYAGCRAMIIFLPEEDFGIAVLSVGDAAANAFNAAVFSHAIDLWVTHPAVIERGAERIAGYARAASDEMARIATAEAALPVARRIDPEQARALSGVYENPRLARVNIGPDENGLVLRAGLLEADLRHVADDRFIIVGRGEVESQAFTFERAADGSIMSFLWDDDRYYRVR